MSTICFYNWFVVAALVCSTEQTSDPNGFSGKERDARTSLTLYSPSNFKFRNFLQSFDHILEIEFSTFVPQTWP